MIFWMLAREVCVLQGKLDQNDDEWSSVKDALVDLFYYQEPKLDRFFTREKKQEVAKEMEIEEAEEESEGEEAEEK